MMQRQGRDALARLSILLKTPIRRSYDRFIGVFKSLSSHQSVIPAVKPESLFKVLKSALLRKGAILVIAALLVPCSALFTVLNSHNTAHAAPSTYLNFQGRLLSNTGNLVPDGYYNIEFKLFDAASSSGSSQGSCAGDANCKWVETYYDSNGVTAGNDNRLRVVNGYFSVKLSSLTAFSGINWDQQMWLTMNIGGSTQTATPTYDGEMTPRIQLTAVPLAFVANNVNSGSTSTASTNSSNVSIQSGNATGTTSNSGNIAIDTGTATGTAGSLLFGTINNTAAITLGSTTLGNPITIGQSTVTNTISIGSANGVSATQTINLGAGTSTTSGGKVINIGTGIPGASTTNTIAIGNGGTTTGTVGITVGSNGAANHTTLLQGGNVNTAGSEAIRIQVSNAGGIAIGTATQTGAIILGNATTATTQNIRISSENSTASTQTIDIGGGTSTTSGGKVVNIANGVPGTSTTNTVAIGTGGTTTGTVGITVGSNGAAAHTTVIQGGNGAGAGTEAIRIAPAATGAIAIGGTSQTGGIILGQSTATNTIAIGNANTATGNTQTINIGAGTPAGTGLTNITIGNILNGGTVNLLSGTGNINLQAAGTGTVARIQIGAGGAGNATPDYLGLDVKSTTGDPAGGAEGYMYYNTFDNKFRCFQDAAWTDCIGAGSGGTLQTTYDADANGSDARIDLTSTDGSLIFSNPSSGGSTSSYVLTVEQLATGAVGGLSVQSAGTGNLLLVTDTTATARDVLKVADGGATTLRNQTDSTAAFQIQSASAGTAVLTVDTTNSQTTLRGINSVASIGADLLTGNCTGTNWTGTGAGPYTHSSGAGVTLTCTITGGVTAGATYEITYTTTGMGATDTIMPAIGGATPSSFSMGNVTGYSVILTTSSTANPTFVIDPSTSTGSVTSITFKLVTLSKAVLTVQNSDGTTGLTVRSGGSTLQNTFIGIDAGLANTSGFNNTGIGYQALALNTSGGGNTAFGDQALYSNTIGIDNVAIGYQALSSNISGSYNTATGYQALLLNTSGNFNIATGVAALGNNSTGSDNIAHGSYALSGNLTGSFNIASGFQALMGNTTGSNNIATGYQALTSNDTGDYNLAYGFQALFGNTTGTGNIAVGANSLGAISTGNYNTALGESAAGTDTDTFQSLLDTTNSTALGAWALPQASNTLILGGAGTDAVNVGIGTTLPTNTFSVSPTQYNGSALGETASQAGTTVTGALSTFTPAMVGGEIIWRDGSKATITAYVSATSLTVTPSQTVADQVFRIHYPGLQVTNAGNVGIGVASFTARLSVVQNGTSDGANLTVKNLSGTQTNGLLIDRSGAGGTTTNLLSLQNTAGTATNGILFTGTIGTDITTAAGSGAGAGRTLLVQAGQGGATGAGGVVLIRGGAGGATSGAGGALNFQGGVGTAGNANGGQASLTGGTSNGSGTGGVASLTGGTGGNTGAGGAVNIQGGPGGISGGAGGNVSILGGTAVSTGTASTITITAGAAQGGNNPGGTLTATSGAGQGSGNGGLFTLQGGAGGATGTGGGLTLKAGNGGATSGAGGVLTLQGGAASASNSAGGNIVINGGVATGTGAASTITIASGAAAGTNIAGGALTINTGAGNGTNAGGLLTIQGGAGGATGAGGGTTIQAGSGGATSGNGGLLTLQGGNATAGVSAGGSVSILGGASTSTGAASTITITSGSAAGAATNGGVINITSGNGNTSGTGGGLNLLAGQGGATGNGGSLVLNSGAGGATSGNGGTIFLNASNSLGGNGTGGLVIITGGGGNGSGAGGTTTVSGGGGGATGNGGALSLNGGLGGLPTSGNGGAVTLQGGAAQNGNSAGGNVSILGGVSVGTGAASTITVTAGSAAGTNIAGGALTVTSGAGNGTNSGGLLSVVGGAGGATGTGGGITLTTGAGGATSGASGALTLQSGNVTSGTAGSVSLDVGTSTSGAPAINIGNSTNSVAKTITIGGTTQTGQITLGQSTATNTVAIGNANTATGNTQTINIGAGTPAGTGLTNINIGNILNGGTVNLLSGTGNINLQAAGTGTVARVQIGAGGSGNSTPDYLALDVKSDTGDPAGGAEGYMYYNTFDNKFRCYQGAAWTDCIGAGAGGTLQTTYDADANGSDARIDLTTTDGSLIFSNPSSGGSASSYVLTVEQLATGAVGGLSVQSAGTGNLLLITDTTATARDVLKVADGGATTLRNQTDSTAAFQIQSSSAGTAVLTVDTTNSQTILRGINSDATLGSELITSQAFNNATYWTCSTGWTPTGTNATHNTGNITDCTATSTNITVAAGVTYEISFDISGSTDLSNGVEPSIGGTTLGYPLTENTTHDVVLTSTGTGSLIFTPNGSSFDGTISNVSVKIITLSKSVLSVQDSTGGTTVQVRGGSGVNANTFIGLTSGESNSSGSSLTAIGFGALQSNTTGAGNSATGANALQSNTSGGNNTANGNLSLARNTIGISNTGTGYIALNANTSGSYNTAVGDSAASANTTGLGNTALGVSSLVLNMSGSYNTAVGAGSGSTSSDLAFTSAINTNYTTTVGANSIAQCSNCVILGGQGIDQVNYGLGINNPTNFLSVTPKQYNAGTVDTTSGTGAVVGTSTTFTSSMVGSKIFISYTPGLSQYEGTVTAFTDATHITVSPNVSQSLSSAPYYILYAGLQVTTAGNVGIGVNSSTARLSVVQNGTSDGVNLTLSNLSGTQTNGLLIDRNGAGGTTTNLLSLQNTAGTATNGILFTGTIATDITTAAGSGAGAGRTLVVGAGQGGATGAGGQVTIKGGAGGATSGAGGALNLQGGNGTTSGSGGAVNINAGTSAGSTAGGAISITTGNAAGGNTSGGALNLSTGNGANAGGGGAITIASGAGGTSGVSGAVNITTGSAGGLFSGNINLTPGTGGSAAAGGVIINGGASTTNGVTGGIISLTSGVGVGNASGGTLSLTGGAGGATGAGAGITLTTGAGGATSGASGALTLQSGNVTSGTAGSVSLDVGTSSTGAPGINIGTNSNSIAKTITLGATGQTGQITIGQSTDTNTVGIAVGTTPTGKTQTVNIGTSASGTGLTNINIGNILNGGTMSLFAGTGSIKLAGVATGTSATFLGLPVKTDAGDPTVTQINGAIYYNSNTNKFRCYEASTWKDCIGTGSGSTLQGAYTSSTGSTTPEIILDTTRNGIDIQDQTGGTIGATQVLFGVRGVATASTLGASLFAVNGTGQVGIKNGGTTATPTLSYDLSFGQDSTPTARTIGVEAQATAATAGNALTITAGTGNTTGAGGVLTLQGGTGGGSGTGGAVTLISGSAFSPGTTGAVTVKSANGLTASASGAVTLTTGNAASGATGSVSINTGNTTAGSQNTGNITIQTGSSFGGNDGSITVQGGGGVSILGGSAVSIQGTSITIGTSDATGTLFVLDTKTGAGNPTGVAGGMYYNSNDGKFRCYEVTTWVDCIGGGGGGANTALSNLASTAINVSLLPGTDDAIDLGDNTHRFRDLFLGGQTLHIGASTSDEGAISYTTSTNVLNIVSTGDISLGTSDTTGTLLILDTKTGAGDPTGSDGAMYFNAASMRFRCYEGGRWVGCTGDGETNFGRQLIKDEFISGTGDETGEIGELGWAVTLTGTAADTSVNASADADHIGVYQCIDSTTNPSGCLLNLGGGQTRIWGGEVIGAVVRTPSSLTATNMYVGLGDATTGTGNSTDAVQLRKVSGTANWQGEVISNTTSATCDTGVAAVASNYVQVKIVVNSAANSTSFYLNGATTASCTIANGLPTASGRELGPIWQFRNADTTGSKTGQIDLFWFERYTGNRWN